tara:strand:+ start:169 stop:408 length:240 start_codon:yes stop_codon:yes gene_type:complete
LFTLFGVIKIRLYVLLFSQNFIKKVQKSKSLAYPIIWYLLGYADNQESADWWKSRKVCLDSIGGLKHTTQEYIYNAKLP